VGKEAEAQLTPITKTFLSLIKTVEIATSGSSNEVFTSLPELILAKFPKDKTVELLHRSSAMLASNPAKVGEWIQFIQSSLATTYALSAQVVSEARELTKVKDILNERLKKLNQHLANMTVSLEEMRKDLNSEIQVKDFLSRRLHDMECVYLKLKADFDHLQHSARLTIEEKMKSAEQLAEDLGRSEAANETLLGEVRKVREVLEVTRRQKKELLDAYRDFKSMFEAFSSDLSKHARP